MAITNFIPEIWSANLLSALRNQLVYAQSGVVNRNYEGDIRRAGDTVRITSIQDVATKAYTRNSGLATGPAAIQYDILSDSQQVFPVNQADYFAFGVDDVDRRQALGGFVEEATTSAAYGLASDTDTYVSGVMAAGVDAGNVIATRTVTSADAYDLLVDFRTKLVRANAPTSGRFVIVPPEMYALLLKDERFIRADAAGTTAGLRNGFVGRAAGFEVIESNVVPFTDNVDPALDTYTVIAGHSMATTFAEQITETEALRLESGFSDAVRGLHVYDAKVVRPTLLTSCEVSV